MASDKLDGRLARLVQELGEAPAGEAALRRRIRVTVHVHVVGDLAEVERAGLWTDLVSGPVAIGTVAAGDLERVAALDAVASIESDRRRMPALHTSVPEIKGDKARNIPPGFSGRGVIVGVIDTGIDIFHQAFRKPDGTTRILSLLDMSLRTRIEMTGNPTGNIELLWQPPRAPAPSGGGPAPASVQESTPALVLPVTAAQVKTALEAFNSIDPGDVTVTGGPLPGTAIEIEFTGKYDSTKIDTLKLPPILMGSALSGTGVTAKLVRGREFRAPEINAALQNPGTPFPSRDVDSHGTHVAGISAGDGSQAGNCHGKDYYIGVAPEADLVIVRSSFLDSEVAQGLDHIFTQPWRGAAPLQPAVVNLSFGGQIGAHDGTSQSEMTLDSMLVGMTGRSIVVAAGNDGVGELHAGGTLAPSGTVTLSFVIADDDHIDDSLDLWYSGTGRLSANVTAPGAGGASLPAPIPAPASTPSPAPKLAGCAVSVFSRINDSSNGKHNISFGLTAAADGKIAQGTWKITLKETSGTAPVTFDCWIGLQRTDANPSFVTADRSRARTVTIPGSAKVPITVGAYDPSDGTLWDASSRGPTADGRPKPDLNAPGAGITAALREPGSTIWCDCCCDFYTVKSGTSMAAPHVTGVVALMFQAKPGLDQAAIKARLIAGARPPDPAPVPPVPNSDWGAGRVDAEHAVSHTISGTILAHADEPVVLPVAAYEAVYKPAHARLAELRALAEGSPMGQLAAALVSEHVDEVQRLVNTERRVLVAWHRMHGPQLLRLLLNAAGRDVPVPGTLGGKPVADGLARLLDELDRAGSPALRAGIAAHRDLLLALPGARAADLDLILRAG
jgi:subtilisin family serine protease